MASRDSAAERQQNINDRYREEEARRKLNARNILLRIHKEIGTSVGRSTKGHHHRYCPYPQLLEIARPILEKEKCTMTAVSVPCGIEGMIQVRCSIQHVEYGTVVEANVVGPWDNGPKLDRTGKPTQNKCQDLGGAISYYSRYGCKQILGVAESDMDADELTREIPDAAEIDDLFNR